MNAPNFNADHSWQTVAIELLRRRAGAAHRMTTPQLRAAGARCESDLARKRIDSLYFVECDVSHARQRVYEALWEAQAREARAVIDELSALGVTPLLFKGAEIGARYDRGRTVCERGDVDLLVSRDAIWKTKKILYGRGYMPGLYRPDTRECVSVDHFIQTRHELQAYEVVPFRRPVIVEGLDEDALIEARQNKYFRVQEDGAAAAFVKIDVHHNILFNFDCRSFVSRSVRSGFGQGQALCPADHLWFLIHRYYGEAAIGYKRGLRGLVWIASIISDPEVDWDLLVRTAVELRATSPCLYWLTFFRSIGASAVPEDVLLELGRYQARSERNWGWQLERWFEIEEPFPELVRPNVECSTMRVLSAQHPRRR